MNLEKTVVMSQKEIEDMIQGSKARKRTLLGLRRTGRDLSVSVVKGERSIRPDGSRD